MSAPGKVTFASDGRVRQKKEVLLPFRANFLDLPTARQRSIVIALDEEDRNGQVQSPQGDSLLQVQSQSLACVDQITQHEDSLDSVKTHQLTQAC
jgi:hypothetical protein